MTESGKSSSWILKIFIVILALVLAGIIFSTVKQIEQKRQVENEIEKLRLEAERIEQENANLGDKISYLESIDYQEKEARDKLNLQKEGEGVIIIKPNLAQDTKDKTQETAPREATILIKKSNIEKWWDYFFKQ